MIAKRAFLAMTVLATCAATTLSARNFSASGVAIRPMPKNVVVSNDSRKITAYASEGEIRRALVSIRSQRNLAMRPFGAAVYNSDASVARSAPSHLAPFIQEAARAYGLDPRLVAAVARQESGFNPIAVSPVGARGVMQLMPATAKYLGVNDSFDARQNIFGGTRYLRTLLDTFKGDLDLTLAAYNAGPGSVAKYGGIPPFTETQNYVRRIRNSYEAALR
jgi:soluble lytic murein transglycosylase-like protein